jgi:hydroxymethylglutaryl-CoA synthase
MTAAHWVASGAAPGKKALVVTADQSRFNPYVPWEYVMGAAATAMLVSDDPRFLELELASNGYWTSEVGDTFRPTSHAEAGNTESSLYCYLDALEGAFEHFMKKAGDIDFEEHTKKNIYHVPFGGLTYQAHRTVMRSVRPMKRREVEESFRQRTRPSLRYNRQLGGTYTSAIILAMMGLLDAADDLMSGDRISVFSYGSGSCAEFYTAKVGHDHRAVLAEAGLQSLCDERRMLSVEEYEAIELERSDQVDNPDFVLSLERPSGFFDSHYQGRGKLYLEASEGFFRRYGWS